MNSNLKHIKNFNKQELTLKTSIAGIELEHPIMNAAGTCKLVKEVKELSKTNTSAIMVGSITVEEREGNPGQTYWSNGRISLNFLGLPNPGANYYSRYLPQMAALASNVGKPLFVSISGFTPKEYAFLADLAFQKGASLVELNLGCPNIWRNGQQMRIPGFDPQMLTEILIAVEEKVGKKSKIAVKLPIFSDPYNLSEIAKVISRSKVVKAITLSNSFPNALILNEKGKPLISSPGGLAAFSGGDLKYQVLGQVKQFRNVLPKSIDIIGVGGIIGGKDIINFLWAGANAVQIATVLLNSKNWRKVFDRLLIEFSLK